MNDNAPLAVATAYFDALAAGDIPAAMGHLDPQIVWHQPGDNRFAGEYTGPDGVGALLGSMMDVSQGSFQLIATGPAMANSDLVAVPVRFVGSRTGASMDMAGIDLLTVRNGKIVEMHLFSEDGSTEDAFWGQS